MATARPFAYNTSGTIAGTTQVGDLAVGFPTSGFTDSPQFWNGPDEELGYVIAHPVSANTQPTPIIISAPTKLLTLSSICIGNDISVTNGGQTASQGFGYQQTVLGNAQIDPSSKVMFSVLFNSVEPATLPGSRVIGIGRTGMNYKSIPPYGAYPGNDNQSMGYCADGTIFYNGNVYVSGLSTWTDNDVIDIVINNNYAAMFVRVNGGYWNNNPTDNPETNTGGFEIINGPFYPALCPGYQGVMTIQNSAEYGVPSGYTLLGSNQTASVGFFRSSALTDESFIELTNSLYNQSFTGATEASSWLTTNGYWNSYNSGVVTTNLQLYLDASNPSSYSGTGNIWYDLSGNGNDVTMQNSGNISWDNSGYFTLTSNGFFNNTSTTNLPIGGSPYTLSVWVQFGSSWGGQGMIGISSTYGGGNSVNAFRTAGTNTVLNYWWDNDFASSFSPPSSTDWFNFVAKWDGTDRSIWVNGVEIGTQTASGLNVSNGVLNIGNTNNGEYLNGNIGQALIYDIALSPTEIISNFDNTKSTYGY